MLVEILMNRDGYSIDEALSRINEAKEALNDYLNEGDFDSAMYVPSEYLGLEPDYVMELIS